MTIYEKYGLPVPDVVPSFSRILISQIDVNLHWNDFERINSLLSIYSLLNSFC